MNETQDTTEKRPCCCCIMDAPEEATGGGGSGGDGGLCVGLFRDCVARAPGAYWEEVVELWRPRLVLPMPPGAYCDCELSWGMPCRPSVPP